MLLTGALPVTLRLIRIYFAHALKQLLCVWLRNVRRSRPVAAALFRLPWNRSGWFLRPLGHIEHYRFYRLKANYDRFSAADSGACSRGGSNGGGSQNMV